MSRKGSQNLIGFSRGNFEKCERAPKLDRNLIELGGRNPEVPVGDLKADGCAAGFCCAIFKRAAGNIADPECPHELEAREPVEAVRVPFSQGRIFRVLTHNWVENELIAEMVNHRCNGERSAESVVEAWFGHGFAPVD
jgi:hypothetical protein